jgi:hypothetical protein
MSTLNALKIRRRLGRERFTAPTEWGPDGWRYLDLCHEGSVIVSVAAFENTEWIHASISSSLTIPSYDDLKLLHAAVFEDRFAFQVFAPPAQHINIHSNALHLWGRLDGASPLPEFGRFGSI